MIVKLLDMTYWRLKRWNRRCYTCAKKQTYEDGKVNFSVAFQTPKHYYHEGCYPRAHDITRLSDIKVVERDWMPDGHFAIVSPSDTEKD